MGLPGRERSFTMFFPLDTKQERDRGQTNGQTDGHRTTAKTALTHSIVQIKVKSSENSYYLKRLKPVSLMIQKSTLRWFGRVERNDWVERCITWKGLNREDARKDPVDCVSGKWQ